MSTAEEIVIENYRAFKLELPALLEEHEGKWVVFHNCKLVEIFEHELEAVLFARTSFERGQYIVQEIEDSEPRPLSYSLLV